MNKKEIIIKYNKKFELINKFNKFYFDKSKPIVSDKEYDDLKREINRRVNFIKKLIKLIHLMKL